MPALWPVFLLSSIHSAQCCSCCNVNLPFSLFFFLYKNRRRQRKLFAKSSRAVCIDVCVCVCVCVCASVRPSVRPSVRQSVSPSVRPCVCVCVCVCVYVCVCVCVSYRIPLTLGARGGCQVLSYDTLYLMSRDSDLTRYSKGD